MSPGQRTVLCLCLALAATPSQAGDAPAGPRRPNVLLIVADDLGYSDLSCYGGEISTPHLDALAAKGLRFSQFYNTARCWPSRAAILTGYYAQQVRRDTVPGVKSGTAGVRPSWARLLPELLKPLGYRSYHSGKWHVDGRPLQNGFDRSYSLEDHDRNFGPKQHTEDDVPLPPVPPGAGYYSTTAIAGHAIRCLQDHASRHPGAPFLAYVAFTSPHFPLQAPETDIARHREAYGHGWDQMRVDRWNRMRSLGLVTGTLPDIERGLGPPYAFPEALQRLGSNEVNRPLPWNSLTTGQQQFQAAKMAVHAAMVDRMDHEIGRVMAQVREMGAEEDTLVMFLSDNGASAEMMIRGDGHDPDARCGTAATFLSLGPGWSSHANTPFRRHKTWVHEGGICTPFIACWPRGITAHGALRHTPAHLIDLVPTVLELAGGAPPLTWGGEPVPPAPGRSLVGVFRQDVTTLHEVLWWQHEGNRALRMGDWKLVAAGTNGPWELYNLANDRTEVRDLSAGMAEKVKEMAQVWERMTREHGDLARGTASKQK